MISYLAHELAQKGSVATTLRGALIHTTGSGVTEQAKKAGCRDDAAIDEFVAHHYLTHTEHPHYLVGLTGEVFSFCDENFKAAHAVWKPWEMEVYKSAIDWRLTWAKDFQDSRVPVASNFYDTWYAKWGQTYTSPAGILKQIGGTNSPNAVYAGIELVDSKPFTEAQLKATAALFVDMARRLQWFDPTLVVPRVLPQPWLCGHSDISPCRRWSKRGGWDPGPENINWTELGNLIVEAAT